MAAEVKLVGGRSRSRGSLQGLSSHLSGSVVKLLS